MPTCRRCGGNDSVQRYRLEKAGAPERELCQPCAEITAAVYGLEPIAASEPEGEGLAASPEEETAEPVQEEPGETVAPEVAEPATKPARKPRGRRRAKP